MALRPITSGDLRCPRCGRRWGSCSDIEKCAAGGHLDERAAHLDKMNDTATPPSRRQED